MNMVTLGGFGSADDDGWLRHRRDDGSEYLSAIANVCRGCGPTYLARWITLLIHPRPRGQRFRAETGALPPRVMWPRTVWWFEAGGEPWLPHVAGPFESFEAAQVAVREYLASVELAAPPSSPLR